MATKAELDTAVTNAKTSADNAKTSESNAAAAANTAVTTKLTASIGSRMFDPNLVANVETENMTSVADTTTGPNRFTIWVPSEKTEFSLGEKPDATKAPNRIPELGIRGETENHVHFRARNPDTLVRLGAKGTQAADTLPETGYLVHTDGSATQESIGPHTIQSTGHNLILHAAAAPPPAPPASTATSAPAPPPPPPAAATDAANTYASLQSNHGFVEVVAGRSATVAAKTSVTITANQSIEPEPVDHDGEHFAGHTGKSASAKYSKWLLNSVDLYYSGVSAIRGFNSVMAAAHKAKSDFSKIPIQDAAKNVIDLSKLMSSAVRLADDFAGGHASGASKVGIGSDGYVSIYGEISSSMYGHLSASVSSMLSASILGGTSSVKGLLFASLWGGLEASMKGRKHAKMEAETGNASVRGNQGLELSSEMGGVTVRALHNVRLNSIGAAFLAHGVEVYCGSDQAGGFGFKATKGYASMGKSKKQDDKGWFDIEKPRMWIDDEVAMIQFGDSCVALDAKEIRLSRGFGVACTIKEDGQIYVEGDKLHFG